MVCSAACPAPRWHRRFQQMLPAILAHAHYAFRHLTGEERDDKIQEVIANALVAFVALVRRGKMDLAYGSVLGKYAVAQIKEGRRVGSKLNARDVLSPYAQRLKGFRVESLDHYDEEDDEWKQAVVQDTRDLPVDQCVAFRVDFKDWLKSLKSRDRQIAKYLSLGNRTSDAAQKFKLDPGRISQLRRELARSWAAFSGGNEANAA